jgi:hypothetical protein
MTEKREIISLNSGKRFVCVDLNEVTEIPGPVSHTGRRQAIIKLTISK